MKSSIPSRLLIRSGDGTWSQTTCRDIEEVLRIWSARKDAAMDVGILCPSLNDVAPRAFDSVANGHAGRMLLTGGMKSRLPLWFTASADPVATVDGMGLFVGLRGFGTTGADTDMEEGDSGSTDDARKPRRPGRPRKRQQDWLAAFVKENPDTADALSGLGIRHEDSYLAGESELPAGVRRRLGVFRANHLAGKKRSDPCVLARAAPPWLRARELNTLSFSSRAANVLKAKGIRTVNDLADWSRADLLAARNFGRTSLASVRRSLVAALQEGPTADGRPLNKLEEWLGAFLSEHPDTTETLADHFITDEDSYLARESELQENLRHRLGAFRAHHLAGAGSTDPCLFAHAAPPWLKQRKMSTLPLSTRTGNVFRVEGIRTVDDLASWSLAELLKAPNFGSTSSANALQALVAALEEGPAACVRSSARPGDGLAEFLRENPDTVEELSEHGIQDESACRARESELQPELRRRLGVFLTRRLIGDRCEDPCELARAAPAWLRDRKFVSMMLPVRVENIFGKINILTVNDLSSWRSEQLLEQYRFGSKSLRIVFQAIDDALAEGPPPTVADGEIGEAHAFLEQFRRSLENLSERERDVLTRRLGFERESETLQQIGDDLGLTRETIRKIELKASKRSRRYGNWCETFARKLTAARKEGKQPLTISGMEKEDLWFKGISAHWRFCENLMATTFKDAVHIIEIDGVRYIGPMPKREWDAMVSSTARKLRRLSEERRGETEIRNFVERQLPPEARELADLLWRRLSPKCQFAALPGGVRVFTGYGGMVRNLVQKILSESDKPLHYKKIFEIAKTLETGKDGKEVDVKTIHFTAASVGLLFRRGTFGLRKHLLLSDEQVAEIRDAAESVISSQPDKQWHAFEILPEVRRRLSRDLNNLDKYALDIVLAGSKRLTRLGRMIWMAAGGEQGRKHIHSEVVAILEEAGRPLSRTEIRERLRSGRGIDKTFQIPAVAPLVSLENYLWGINDRDVPVKRERQLELIESLVRELEARQCGVHESELHEFLELDGCHARTFASIAVQDSRLKKDYERHLYLAEWGKARRHTIRSALLQITGSGGEPSTFRETVERVEALVGRNCNQQSIYNAMRALKARKRK